MIGMLFRAIRRVVINLSILTVIILLAPGLPPYNATFSSHSITSPLPLTGALAPNGELDSAELLFEGKFTGPESIAWKTHDEIFVSIHGGTIIRIFGKNFDRIAEVTRIGPTCAGPWQERLCGRPLGLRFAPDGKLLVVDAYYGIFSVDVDTGEKECLIPPDQKIEGEPFKLANDLDIDSDGNIYWSDSSTNADLSSIILAMMADPTGRLIKYDPKTGSNVVLLKDIQFANGVQLSSNQDFVLLCETAKGRVHRYWLKGDMAGHNDIFLDGLPGLPDNIRPRPDGGFYVSLYKPRLAGKKEPFIYLVENFPLFRKFLVRVLSVAQLIIDGFNKVFPHEIWERASYNVLNLTPFMAVLKTNISIVVEVDEEGNILGSLQGSIGKITQISEAAHVGDNIFFGSPRNKFLGRLYVGEPITWEAEDIRSDKVRMPSRGKDDEATPPSDEDPSAQDTPLFEDKGQDITIKEPNEDTEKIEMDETKIPKYNQVKVVEVDSKNDGIKAEIQISSELQETQDDKQSLEGQIKDQTIEGQKKAEQVDSKEFTIDVYEQNNENEQQHVEITEVGATAKGNPVNVVKEDVTNAEDEMIIGTDDAVQEEVREVINPVDSEITKAETEEEDQPAQSTGDTDGVPNQREEHMAEAAMQYVEEHFADGVPEMENSMPNDEQSQQQSDKMVENKEVYQAQVQESKDEL